MKANREFEKFAKGTKQYADAVKKYYNLDNTNIMEGINKRTMSKYINPSNTLSQNYWFAQNDASYINAYNERERKIYSGEFVDSEDEKLISNYIKALTRLGVSESLIISLQANPQPILSGRLPKLNTIYIPDKTRKYKSKFGGKGYRLNIKEADTIEDLIKQELNTYWGNKL